MYPARNEHAPYCRLRPDRLYNIFPHSHKQNDHRKKKYWAQCCDSLYNFCLKHFSCYEEPSEMWPKTYTSLHVKYSLFLSDFNKTLTFSTNIQISHFMKIRLAGAELLCRWTDGQTDMTNLTAAFRNFAIAAKSYRAPARVHLLPGEGKAVHLLTLSLNPLTPNDLYESYRTANLQTLHFIYLFNKCRYWIF